MVSSDAREVSELDRQSVRRAQKGDSRAMDDLVRRHHGSVFRLCLSILRDSDAASDATQETFVKAFAALSRFRGDAAFRSWLLTIAGNEARAQWRRTKRRRESSLEEAQNVAADIEDVADRVATVDHARRVRAVVDDLPEKQRLAVTLRIEEGLSFKEIGEIIDSTEGSARVNYHHGIRRLREKLE